MNADGSGVSAPDVSVIIVSYNTRRLLEECLRSLLEQTATLRLEVIVVDNASSDGSPEAVRRGWPLVRLIANEGNAGFAAASNQGIRASVGEYVLLLNPDTVVLDHAIERLVDYLTAQPHVGACGPRLCFPDGAYQRSAYPWPSITGALYEYSALFHRFPALARGWVDRPEESRPVGYCSGACFLITRRCLDAVGLLDEGYHMYGEDVDWCTRMWRHGWQVHYVREASVVHYLGASTGDTAKRRLKELHGKLRYLRTWRSPLYVAAYRVAVGLCSLYRYGRWRTRELAGGTDAAESADHILLYKSLLRVSLGRST